MSTSPVPNSYLLNMTERILLVDDDRAFRNVYATLLCSTGIEVDEADDRPSARDAVAAHDYPVILLDLMLPPDGSVNEGLAQLAEILSSSPATKVIVASGAGDQRFVVLELQSSRLVINVKAIQDRRVVHNGRTSLG